ncbi:MULTISPECIES: hypothetical protein [Klebsiella]|uniref:hypothetical protein n=1 Tax=Klebsiella TaxID=570 RepID=UPI001ABEF00A|nr:hypothetical protein [Klebsiella quasipneumoniae]HED4103680.1 hypothetical protein [Klebsiella aerogenes]
MINESNSTLLESIEKQIPYYLTEDAKKGLTQALNDFPKNTQYYLSKSTELSEVLLQGDLFAELPVQQGEKTKLIKGIILSNSCDISPDNKRDLPVNVLFAPLVSLDSYSQHLRAAGLKDDAINSKIEMIRLQKITNIFYLPESIDNNRPECIIYLDCVYFLRSSSILQLLEDGKKISTLSQVGFYIFLLKLSVHFCRFHECVHR